MGGLSPQRWVRGHKICLRTEKGAERPLFSLVATWHGLCYTPEVLAPYVEQSFLKGLERDFGGEVRLRWSPQRNRWQLERKGVADGGPVDPKDRLDAWIRRRDRFYRILETSPGSRVACSFCGNDYSHPMFTLQAAKCPHCEKEELVMNWPLGEKLLEHLRFTDPSRDGLERMWRELEAAELAKEKSSVREKKNLGEAIWKEEFNRVFEIQSKGYTGKDHAWVGAPESKRFGGNE